MYRRTNPFAEDDGKYTRQQFIDFYGPAKGAQAWEGVVYKVGMRVRALVKLEGERGQFVFKGNKGEVLALPGRNSNIDAGAVAEVLINGVRFDAQPHMIEPVRKPVRVDYNPVEGEATAGKDALVAEAVAKARADHADEAATLRREAAELTAAAEARAAEVAELGRREEEVSALQKRLETQAELLAGREESVAADTELLAERTRLCAEKAEAAAALLKTNEEQAGRLRAREQGLAEKEKELECLGEELKIRALEQEKRDIAAEKERAQRGGEADEAPEAWDNPVPHRVEDGCATCDLRAEKAALPDALQQGIVLPEKAAGTAAADAFASIAHKWGRYGNLDEALRLHTVACEIREKCEPGSLSLADAYFNLGQVCGKMGDLGKAVLWYTSECVILEKEAPGSLDLASTYRCLSKLCGHQNKEDEALRWCHAEREIREKETPGSLGLAHTYYCIGDLLSHSTVGNDVRVAWYDKARVIREKEHCQM